MASTFDDMRARLVGVARAYAKATDLELSSVGMYALRDGRFFERIKPKNGGKFGMDTYDRAMQWFSDRWPEHAKWPDGTPRPAPTAKDSAA